MRSKEQYTICMQINSSYSGFVVCNRCIVEYNIHSFHPIDDWIDRMESGIYKGSLIQQKRFMVFKSDIWDEQFGENDVDRCYNVIATYFGCEPDLISFLPPKKEMSAEDIRALFERYRTEVTVHSTDITRRKPKVAKFEIPAGSKIELNIRGNIKIKRGEEE